MAKKTICMLSCLHGLYDDRIYWKEALSLKNNGYDVIHIGVGEKDDDFISEHGIRMISISTNTIGKKNILRKVLLNLFFLRKKFKQLLRIAKSIQADVYNLHDLQLISLIKPLKKQKNKPQVIYSIHESYPDMIRDYTETKGIKTFIKKKYAFYIEKWEIAKSRSADYLVTFDDAMYQKFSKIIEKSKVSLIYNFTNFEAPSTTSEEKEYDLIYLGGISKQRGILQLLEAVAICKKHLENIKLLLLGTIHDPLFKKNIINKITELKIKENVIIHKTIPYQEVEGFLKRSKIGLVTLLPIQKFLKNIPIKQFEYMAAGLPIVGSNIPPIKKFIEEANAGIVVNPKEPTEIANAVLNLLNNTTLYNKFSANGKKAVIDKYNWQKEEVKMLSLYKSLLLEE